MNARSVGSLMWAASFALLTLATAMPTLAKPVKWNLEDVTFQDGGTAVGSFLFDANASSASASVLDFDITTTDGTVLTGVHYTPADAAATSSGFGINLSSASLHRQLDLTTGTGLSGIGITIPLSGFESSSGLGGGLRSLKEGGVSSVPEPSDSVMMGIGLVGVITVWVRRR